ncbi:MAG: enoyl-ACP reductase [Chlorobiota bacterium]|nr:enoyl-ACP reductase [Chlorobiota bacterium]QQS67756.1 MAG: enoyl-ACP reductase [Chlorobiota bacterium]
MAYGLLNGKKGIVFGPMDETSLGWSIALAAQSEGADVEISNIAIATRVGRVKELAKILGDKEVYVCDASNFEELSETFKKLKEKVGKIDFIIHSVGMSNNIRKEIPYQDLNYDWYSKTLDVSAMSLHKMINAALKQDVLNDFASIISLSYVAAQRVFQTYTDMGDAKALLESITRSFGARLGEKKIRVNAVSQSPTPTRAGTGIEDFDNMFEFTNRVSPLGNATSEECANYVVTLLSDFTKKVTMQTLFHDGGYSMMGITQPMLRLMNEALKNDEMKKKAGY